MYIYICIYIYVNIYICKYIYIYTQYIALGSEVYPIPIAGLSCGSYDPSKTDRRMRAPRQTAQLRGSM